jgi:protein O-GlcNAc transferase
VQAAAAYRRSLELDPRSFPAQLGLSSALVGNFDMDGAIDAARKAAELDPSRAEPIVNLALALARSGRGREAVAALREATARIPDHPLLLANLAVLLPTRPESTPEEALEAHTRLGRIFSAYAGTPVPTFGDTSPDRRLRIGYISQEFRDGAIPHFIRGVLKAHDRKQFEVFCYSANPAPDSATAAVKALADRWVEVGGINDIALDRQIRADSIDILVDLSGATPGGRISVFPRRPAPVLVSFPTYPGSTGVKAVGHRIVDEITDPPGSESLAIEKLTRLPGCCLCFTPSQGAPASGKPRGDGGTITFGAFVTIPKISEPALDAWAAILKAVPGSHLILKAQPFAAASASDRFMGVFAQRGIAAERITLAGHTASPREHLAAYSGVDIALDTFPASSPATACEALYMGVPVVTLTGKAHAGRTTTSILAAAGLESLAATDEAGYIRIATDLARDRARLADFRRTLRDKLLGSPVCDAAGYTSRLEAAYRDMWRASTANQYYTE